MRVLPSALFAVFCSLPLHAGPLRPGSGARPSLGSREVLLREVEQAAGSAVERPTFSVEPAGQRGGLLHLRARMKNGFICQASPMASAYCLPGLLASEKKPIEEQHR